jgi:hypothetical protein
MRRCRRLRRIVESHDVIVFSPNSSGVSIQRVSASGGAPADVTKTKGAQLYPVFLPGGSHFLYTAGGTAEASGITPGIYVSSLAGRENRRVLPDASSAVFAPSARGARTGHLLFVRENTLMSAPFVRLRDAADGLSSCRPLRLRARSVVPPASPQVVIWRLHHLLGCDCVREVGRAAVARCSPWATSVSLR